MSKFLNFFHIALYRAQRYCRLHPKIVLATTVLLFMAFAVGIPRLQFLLAIDDLIDPDFKTYQSFKSVNEEFKDKNGLVLLIKSETVFKKQELCDLQTWVLQLVERRKDIQQITSTFGVRRVQIENSQLSMRSVFDLNCDDPVNAESEKIEQAFQYVKNSPWNQILSTKTGYGLLLNFRLKDADDQTYGSVNIQGASQIQIDFDQNMESKIQGESIWSGFLVYQQELRQALDQTQALNMLLFIFSLLLFKVCLNSWRAGIIFNGTVFIAMTLTYGLMGYFKVPIDVLTNAVGIMLMVSCLEDFAFVAYGIIKLRWTFRKSLRKFLIPSFYTSLSTFIGFGSLTTSDLEIIRRFGSVSAFATLVEWSLVFLFLPSCLSLFHKTRLFSLRPGEVRVGFLEKISHLKTSYAVSVFLTAAVIVSLLFANQLKVKDSPDSFFFKDHKTTLISNKLRQELGWITDISLVFAKENSEQRNRQIIDEFRKNDFIKKIESPYEIADFLVQEIPADLKTMMKNQWESSAFSGRLISENGIYRAQMYVPNMEMDEVTNLIQKSKQICPQSECELVGALISYNEFGDRVLQTFFSGLGTSLLMVMALIIFLGRSMNKKILFYLALASVWGPLALMSIFIVFQIPLFFVSSVCASVLVGIAGDNAIQFIYLQKNKSFKNGMDMLAPACLIITAGMILFSSVFLFSVLQPLVKLGFFIIIGFLLGFVGDVTILRGFFKDEK